MQIRQEINGGPARQSMNLLMSPQTQTARERYFQFVFHAELIKRRLLKDYPKQRRSIDMVEVIEV